MLHAAAAENMLANTLVLEQPAGGVLLLPHAAFLELLELPLVWAGNTAAIPNHWPRGDCLREQLWRSSRQGRLLPCNIELICSCI